MTETAIQELNEKYNETVQKIHELYSNPIPLTDVEKIAQQRAEQRRQLQKAEAEAERIEAKINLAKQAAQATEEYVAAVERLNKEQDKMLASLDEAMKAAAICHETRALLRGGAFKLADRSKAQLPPKLWTVSLRNKFRSSHLFATDI